MRVQALASLLLFLPAFTYGVEMEQSQETGVLQGAVYDLYGAVIVDVLILVEREGSGEIVAVRTDQEGKYEVKVQPGRYRVSMRPHPGYPVGYEHSSFSDSAGEKVIINFRPSPYAISSSIEDGKWIEKYEGVFPSFTTQLIQQASGTIRDLRIKYHEVRTNRGSIEYRYAVVTSFDRLTVYSDKAVYYPKHGRVIAEGNVLFEDGQRAVKAKRVEIDLLTNKSNAIKTVP